MCLPAAAMAAIAVASTAATIITEVQTAKTQNRAITDDLAQGRKQVAEQEGSDMNARAREARKEQGRMAVAAGEAGLQLSSGSVEAMLLDSAMQQKAANESIGLNAEHQNQGLTSEANHAYSQVQEPSVIGAGLRLVSAGVTGYANGRSAALSKQAISRPVANRVTGGG